ncbi:serine hydrolase [Paenibacillus sp. J22TS3]|uniref:serine hydrolase domain-containing protein n=1 Tax=Paenibacillus sp. J22TS3 TaxID=2807192 RepID=UPI001BD07D7D|nr:serine hydrolase domain-containing protein [Paenibacillus sp. J22TS3]
MSTIRRFICCCKAALRGWTVPSLLLLACCLSSLSAPAVQAAGSDSRPNVDSKINKFMETAMSQLHIPGAAVGIVTKDQIVYLKGYGVTGPNQTPVTPETSFVLGSTTKSFTALAVMQLVEAGMIDLNAPVTQYLPSFKLADKSAAGAIRVRDLLHQTSGLSEYDGRVGMMKCNKPIKEHLRDLSTVSLIAPPGTAYQYSNLNYNILGGIIEAVSGESYANYVHKHIFQPLDMKYSFASPEEAGSHLATGYQSLMGYMIPTKQLPHTGTVASGYLISSAGDLAHYMMAQMNRDKYLGTSVLSPGGVEQMHAPATDMGGGAFYGMGWTIKNGVTFHDGMTENTYSMLVMDGDYGIILLTNALDYLIPYDRIAIGLSRILHGQDPEINSIPSVSQTYIKADLALLAVLAYLVWTLNGLFKWRTQYQSSRRWLCIHTGIVGLVHLILPIAILIYVPKVFSAPWPVVQTFLPGLGHVLYYLPMLLIALGVLKAVLMFRRWALAKNASAGTNS